jgi:hypothetical protein
LEIGDWQEHKSFVIPAKAGIHLDSFIHSNRKMDSGLTRAARSPSGPASLFTLRVSPE